MVGLLYSYVWVSHHLTINYHNNWWTRENLGLFLETMTARHFIIFSHHFWTISPPLICPWSTTVFRPLPALQDGKEKRKGLLFGQVLSKLGVGANFGKILGGKCSENIVNICKNGKNIGHVGENWWTVVHFGWETQLQSWIFVRKTSCFEHMGCFPLSL